MPSKRKIVIETIETQPSRSRKILPASMTLLAALALSAIAASVPAAAQQQGPEKFHFGAPEVAITYDIERAKIANIGCGCFWLQGGSVDLAVPLYKGLSVAGRFGGAHDSNIKPGVNLGEITYMAGPRYTFFGRKATGHGPQVFGEALFGGVHGFDSIFPSSNSTTASANSYAMQLGGGVDIALTGGLGLRAVEVDYVRTALPNNGSNIQNDLRLAFGLTYHF